MRKEKYIKLIKENQILLIIISAVIILWIYETIEFETLIKYILYLIIPIMFVVTILGIISIILNEINKRLS